MWERCDEARPPAGQDPDVVGLGVRFIKATRDHLDRDKG